MLIIVANVADGVIFPLFQKRFVSLMEPPVPAGQNFMQFALPTIIAIALVWMGIDIFYMIRGAIQSRLMPKVRNRVSEILNNYAFIQSMSFWNSRMTGKINSQIGYISQGFQASDAIVRILAAVIIIFVNTGPFAVALNQKIAYILAGVFLFRLLYSFLLMRPINKWSEIASDSSSALNGKLVDSISNYYVVKLFSGIKSEEKLLGKYRKKSISDRITANFWGRLFWAIPAIVWNISFGVIMFLCARFFMSGEMQISDVAYTVSVFFAVRGAINSIADRIPELIDTIGSAKQSYKELVKPITVQDMPNAPDLKVTKGQIEFRNVSFKYKHKMVVEGLSLIVKPGEKVGLVGSSGSGKTTLVNLLVRFYDPTKGQILIDGQDIKEVTQDSLRNNIAFIPQDPTMFNRTLKENIGYGKFGATDAEIRKAAKHAEAHNFIMATDKKYNSIVGDKGIKLSGGQRQRIAIARAFLKNAPILILDEATSALDSETESIIQKSFNDLSKGKTLITVAHRLSTLRHMDRIVVIENGKIVESGSHHQLLKKRRGKYAKLWKMQSGGFVA